MFAYQDNEEPRLALDGCRTQWFRLDPPQGISELLVEVLPAGSGPARVRLVYDRSKVAEPFVRRLRDEYREILHTGERRLTAGR